MRDGLLIIKKPKGMTSHDVVQVARRKLGVQRIGHTGTLDPMAEGVLVLLVGRATKTQREAQTHRKRYDVIITFGTQTDTGDAWGQPVKTAAVPVLDRGRVDAVLASFVGRLTQVPPAFSAAKVRGRPLYWWARRGERPSAPAKTVEIFSVELLACDGGQLRCRVECSAGTYIRSLAEVVAERLGTVGHVSELTRTAVGTWELSQAIAVEQLQEAATQDAWNFVRPMETSHAGAHRT